MEPLNTFLTRHFAYDAHSYEHQLLLGLSAVVLVLFVFSLGVAMLAILLRMRNNRTDRMWQRLHELWDLDILNVLSGDLAQEEFRKLVEPRCELNFIRFLAPYAYRLRGSDMKVLSELASYYLPHVSRQLKHKDSGVRVWAINILGLFGMPEYEHSIIVALRDEAPIVAMFAASTLLAQKKVVYIKPVMAQFHRFEKWHINSLATLLTNIGAAAIPELEEIFLDPSQQSRTRVVAAEALRRLNDYAISYKAAELLQKCEDEELLVACLRLLGDIGQPLHRLVVLPFCLSESDVIRINAMRTMRHLGTSEDLELFRTALDDPNPWVARQAAKALKALGDSATLEQLVRDNHPRAMLAREILASGTRPMQETHAR